MSNLVEAVMKARGSHDAPDADAPWWPWNKVVRLTPSPFAHIQVGCSAEQRFTLHDLLQSNDGVWIAVFDDGHTSLVFDPTKWEKAASHALKTVGAFTPLDVAEGWQPDCHGLAAPLTLVKGGYILVDPLHVEAVSPAPPKEAGRQRGGSN